MDETQFIIIGNELDSDGWALIAPYGEWPKARVARVNGAPTEQRFLQVLDNASADKLMDKESGLFRSLKRALVGIPVYLGHPDLAEHSPETLANAGRKQDAGVPESENLQRLALAMRQRLFGSESAEAAISLKQLAINVADEEKYTEASDLLHQAMAIQKRSGDGESQLEYASLVHSMGRLWIKISSVPSPGRPANPATMEACYEKAEECFREAIAMWRKLVNNEHPSLDSSLSALGDVFLYHAQCRRLNDRDDAGAAVKYEEAAKAYREALPIRRKLYGDHSMKVASCLANLGNCLLGMAETSPEPRLRLEILSEVEKVGRDSLAIRESLTNETGQAASLTNEIIEAIRYDIGELLFEQGKTNQAILAFTEAADHGYSLAQRTLADFYAKGDGIQKDPIQAEKWLLKAAARKDVRSLNALAWFRATNPDARVRNGAVAVDLANQCARLTDRKDPEILDTLGAAYAEAGEFSLAIATQEEAIRLLRSETNNKILSPLMTRDDEIEKLKVESKLRRIAYRLILYQALTPYREQ